ncbi:MAG TPA: D-glycerate dehydrogenase [Capillimicrobium sp.]
MPKVAVTRRLPFPALERLAAAHEVVTWPGELPPAPAELRELADGADGLLCLLTDRVDAALLGACPRLRAVAVYAVGTDNVDLAAAAQRGVAVGNSPDVLTEATADLAFALLLAAARRLPEAAAAVREPGGWRTWEPAGWLGLERHGATLGIVGAGRIGEAVARRAEGFGMRVLRSRPAPLPELLAVSDAVSLHVPLTPQTRRLIDAAALGAMKPGAILVNTARGPIVDQEALAAALRSGRLGAAALDVTDPEPLPFDHPLLDAPNLLVVPHIGSATTAARARMADMAVDNLLAALDGEPMPHPVA